MYPTCQIGPASRRRDAMPRSLHTRRRPSRNLQGHTHEPVPGRCEPRELVASPGASPPASRRRTRRPFPFAAERFSAATYREHCGLPDSRAATARNFPAGARSML